MASLPPEPPLADGPDAPEPDYLEDENGPLEDDFGNRLEL